ncbi:MAG: type II toxin-antitoxin system RelE/ParE family toxin [Chloroflexi bacterium]|nr:type II toxin-antitoxin system RelE/ParE family toxin [Chloroflexota bacterium]
MYEVTYLKQAERKLLKMPRNLSKRIRKKLGQIAENPYAQHNNVTKLRNHPGYRLRVGDWRVIYEIQDGELIILVVKIAPRGEVYR